MVTRYPHTALITYEIGGKLVNGEWVDGETKTLSVKEDMIPLVMGA